MSVKFLRRTPLNAPLTISLEPVSSECLNAKDFIALTKRNPSAIKSSKIVPPRPGRPGFGCIEVEYSTPILKPAHG